ncbi:hypothetical protein ACHAXT_006470 [Thalassiosira profunda]
MIRTAFLRPAAAASRAGPQIGRSGAAAVRRLATGSHSSSRTINSSPALSISTPSLLRCKNHGHLAPLLRLNNATARLRPNARRTALRSTSSSTGGKQSADGKTQSAGGESAADGGEPTSQEIVLTPGEKVVAGTRLTLWAGALAFASVCAYYIGKELLPTKMSPNTVFDKATHEIRQNPEVARRFGEAFKTYGRDHGGHREGRRNFIEHTEYTDPDDGSKRTRVRFNLEGPYGAAFVFAEVSKDMPSGEFVYILVQDKRNGAVITVQDNRSAILARRLAGGSKEGQDVFSNLLGGGGGQK